MPPPRMSTHALSRGLQRLALGTVRDMQRAEARRRPNRLQEGEQQFQIPISGTAGKHPAWVEEEVEFSYTFVNATGQRDSWLEEPQFSYGVRLVSQTPVVVSCSVMDYDKKDADEIEGARIAVGVFNPAGGGIQFKGLLHLTFQGFGAPGEFEMEDVE